MKKPIKAPSPRRRPPQPKRPTETHRVGPKAAPKALPNYMLGSGYTHGVPDDPM
jgi:hypothetical protein